MAENFNYEGRQEVSAERAEVLDKVRELGLLITALQSTRPKDDKELEVVWDRYTDALEVYSHIGDDELSQNNFDQ